eukprot:TRINITY_DN2420_c0_g1_i1.p1 TRINITY_DN2420_c0_g1~~TRINITY_DN2420_c0_g1_i1.p1  ORF type:complete len:205 (-),score=32.13 TRINITY_DN2420_c0_g1_i1:164-778(-)
MSEMSAITPVKNAPSPTERYYHLGDQLDSKTSLSNLGFIEGLGSMSGLNNLTADSRSNLTGFASHDASIPQVQSTPSMPLQADIQDPQSLTIQQNDANKAIITSDDSNKQSYIDITEHLNLPQTEAAKKLGIPTSTLSKRWKEAVVNRKWPYRTVCKLEKEIMTLLHNIPQGPEAPALSPEIEHSLSGLLRKRQEELRTVIIRL